MAQARPFELPASSQVLVGTKEQGCRYHGFSLLETTGGASAHVRLREGGASGRIVDTILVQAGLDKGAWYGLDGVFVDGELYVERVSGTLEGTIYVS